MKIASSAISGATNGDMDLVEKVSKLSTASKMGDCSKVGAGEL